MDNNLGSLDKYFSKVSEIYDIFKQFKLIENIYDNSLIAMGYKPANNLVSADTSNYVSNNMNISTVQDK
jgi:hypothetical protein